MAYYEKYFGILDMFQNYSFQRKYWWIMVMDFRQMNAMIKLYDRCRYAFYLTPWLMDKNILKSDYMVPFPGGNV